MKAFRTIINSDKIDRVIPLPQDLKHSQVEVIIFPIEKKKKVKVKKSFNPDNYIGFLKLKDSKKTADSLRSEWDRF